MKVLLATDESEVKNGFVNIMNRLPSVDKIPGYTDGLCPPIEFGLSEDLLEFGEIIFDGEVDLLEIPSLLEYVNNVDIYIRRWLKLVAIDGIISIGGTDLLQLTNDISAGKIDGSIANQLLYANNKRGCYHYGQVVNELKDNNFEIQKIVLSGINYNIVAKRIK